jgi:hypothetical protein
MLEIKRADTAGVALLLQWAKVEDWNPGHDDAQRFLRNGSMIWVGGAAL